MRIAFLSIETEEYQKKAEFINSTNIAYLMSYLEINFKDTLIFPLNENSLLPLAKPDIVCIYAPYSSTFNQVIETVTYIKETVNVPVIILGDHITYLPKTLPINADVGIIGEGEETLREVIQLVKDNNFNEKSLSEVAGIVFHSRGQKIITNNAQIIDKLDSLPLTRRFFYKMPGNWLPSLITGRGNPKKNIYSHNNIPIRLNSAERIINDLVDIMTFHPEKNIIPVRDHLFLHDINRFKNFIEIVEKTNLTKHLRLEINAQVEQLNDEVLYLLRHVLDTPQLNIYLSSPSEKIQKELKENPFSINSYKKVIDSCYKYNIKTKLFFLTGFIAETKEEASKNYWTVRSQYLNKFKDFKSELEVLIPKPGTEMWQKAAQKKLVNTDNFNWDNLNPTNLTNKSVLLSNVNSNETNLMIQSYKDLNKVVIKQSHLDSQRRKHIESMTEKISKIAEDLISDIGKIYDEMFYNMATKNYPDAPNITDYLR
ncbi:MAG: hypothetical protein H7263_08010, partial [Candidatus Sericytochromatia bacterium]|nr:hypothetical protein [Candidatus Sericytochromatia bacterium]